MAPQAEEWKDRLVFPKKYPIIGQFTDESVVFVKI